MDTPSITPSVPIASDPLPQPAQAGQPGGVDQSLVPSWHATKMAQAFDAPPEEPPPPPASSRFTPFIVLIGMAMMGITTYYGIQSVKEAQEISARASDEFKTSVLGMIEFVDKNSNSFTVRFQDSGDPKLVRAAKERWQVALPPGVKLIGDGADDPKLKLCRVAEKLVGKLSEAPGTQCRDILKVGRHVLVQYLSVDPTQGKMIAKTIFAEKLRIGESPVTATENPFGVMMPQAIELDKRAGIAKDSLKGRLYRPLSVFVDSFDGTCRECDAAVAAGLKLALTVRANGGAQNPTESVPPEQVNTYKQKLGEIVARYKDHIAVLVIENEENSSLFYKGTPEEYEAILRAGCEVAHLVGVKCANGGLVSNLVSMLVYGDLRKSDEARAMAYLEKTLDTADLDRVKKQPATLETQILKGMDLLRKYKRAGADFVNFHWYADAQEDPEALSETVAFLRRTTGLPVITNEMGQQQTTSQSLTTAMMLAVQKEQLPIAVWYSIDAPAAGGARALMEFDGTLRENGETFKSFIEANY